MPEEVDLNESSSSMMAFEDPKEESKKEEV